MLYIVIVYCTLYLPKHTLFLRLRVLICWAGTTLLARRAECDSVRCRSHRVQKLLSQPERGGEEGQEWRNACMTTTAFRNKIYSNFKQRIYFRRKIWKSISIRYFCVAQQSEWDHSKKQSHSWTGMRQFGAWIDPDTGHLIQKLLYPTLFPPPTPTHTTIHALQMTRFKNSILYSIFLNRIMFKLS